MTKNWKLKIAIFHCGFIYSGGGERIVLEEAKGLIKRGWDVRVFAPTLDEKMCYPEMVKKLKVKTLLPSFFGKLLCGNAVQMVASSVMAPFLSYSFRDTDVFLGANQPGAWIAFCMAKVLNKPYLVYLNQPNRVVYPRPVDERYGWATTVKDYQVLYRGFRLVKPLLAFFDRLSVSEAEVVFTNGKYIGGVIENVYSKNTIDNPAGSYVYPFSKLNLNPDSAYSGKVKIKNHSIKKPYILITNRHDPKKRFDFVISAMKTVLKKNPGTKLVIPGPFTKHTEELIRKAKRDKVKESVFFLGKVSEDDLQKLYRHAAVYCYPSPEEDFGLGPLEAGGWGVPTVAWNHGGPSYTVVHKKTGYLAEPYDINDYARGINFLLSSPKKRSLMGKAARDRVRKHYSWERHLDILEGKAKRVLK